MKLLHPFLYLFVLAGSLFILAVSFGEILWGASVGSGPHWSERMFDGICHRIPDRTYSSGNLLMAVNTRCFGVFAGMAAGFILMPLLKKFTVGNRWPILLLLAAVAVQITDYAGNMFELWENTNHSRAVLGSLLGLSVPLSVSELFYQRKTIE
ncbi:DUF2085 domain-containing protein [Rhodohalobacter sp. SW132]|uniref:DUF2085 domain-containing protein n=1 Tax=Rhodohalobacter sp. SW132 TaxID=2293433 RepID=UPI000E275BC0|nr:DUF2085 domain-containing protein [Rhodohalobacter sp. SW132]REL24568.1 DUF2085 domain-containing protein [Rhodohalobacter sp. SW132]